MDKDIIVAEGLSKRVPTSSGELVILSEVSFSIKQGETIAIVGASGSGKSTLLGLLAGLDRPSSGNVYLQGHDLARLSEDGRARLRGRHVGFVFQNFQLLPALTAQENVALPLELQGCADAQQQAHTLLQRVGLGERLQHTPRQLSGGEQQRVALARAFITRPSILFADEPTGNLDTHTGEQVMQVLFELNREYRATLVLVTHDSALAERCARRIHLVAGEISADEVQP